MRTDSDAGLSVLKIQAGPQLADAVARNLQLRMLSVFEADHHAASEPGSRFFDIVHIEKRGAMNTDELCRIQLLLQFSDRVVDDIVFRECGSR